MTGTIESQSVSPSDLTTADSLDYSTAPDSNSSDLSDKIESLNLTTCDEFIDMDDL
jgi:hypothetical protein